MLLIFHCSQAPLKPARVLISLFGSVLSGASWESLRSLLGLRGSSLGHARGFRHTGYTRFRRGPKTAQDGPQEGPKTTQGSPKTAQEAFKTDGRKFIFLQPAGARPVVENNQYYLSLEMARDALQRAPRRPKRARRRPRRQIFFYNRPGPVRL